MWISIKTVIIPEGVNPQNQVVVVTTVSFSDKRCVHTSHQDRLLCLTLIVFSLSVPKQQEVHPKSSERTGDSRVSRLKDILQLPDGPKQG